MSKLDRNISPDIHPISDIQLIPPRICHLDNGIPMYIFDNEQLDLIHIIISLKIGVLTEQQKHITRFTYKLLKESSERYSSNEIADLFAFYGTHYSTSVALDKTDIKLCIPKHNCNTVLPVVYDFLAHPKFRESNLSIYKNRQIKDLEYNSCKTDFRATKLMLNTLFGEQTTAGQFSTKENLQSVTIEQMADYHDLTFQAENMTIFATGNIDTDIEQCISRLFSQIPTHQHEPLSFNGLAAPVTPAAIINEKMPDCLQSTIELGMPFIGYNNPEHYDFDILTTIFGGYFGSRLMQNLREKHGYTYGISADAVYFNDESIFIMSSDVNVNDTRPAMEACFEEMARLQEELVPPEELQAVQSYLLGEVLRDIDNSVSYMKEYSFWHKFGLDEQEFSRHIDHIRNIRAERIQELAKKYFNYNNFTQIIVGDKFD